MTVTALLKLCLSCISFSLGINGITPELAAPTGPFRNVGLSKAAQTHRLRKLRAPSKCRECNSYVYFQGAECEEVGWDSWGWNPALTMVRRIFLLWGGFQVENGAFLKCCSIPKAFFLSLTVL